MARDSLLIPFVIKQLDSCKVDFDLVTEMKVYLCGKSGCCPYVEVTNGTVRIGEEGNSCTLSEDQWNALVDEINVGRLGRVERIAGQV